MASFTKEGNNLIAQERLFLDSAQEKVVREGDPRAAFLLAGKGCAIPLPIVKRLKLDADTKPEPRQAAEKKGVEPQARSTRPASPEATR